MENCLVTKLKESISSSSHFTMLNDVDVYLDVNPNELTGSGQYQFVGIEGNVDWSIEVIRGKAYSDSGYTTEQTTFNPTIHTGYTLIILYRNPNDETVPIIRIHNYRNVIGYNTAYSASKSTLLGAYLGDFVCLPNWYRGVFLKTMDEGNLESLFASWIFYFDKYNIQTLTSTPPQLYSINNNNFKWAFNNVIRTGTYGVIYDKNEKIATVYFRRNLNIDNITENDTILATYNLETNSWDYE